VRSITKSDKERLAFYDKMKEQGRLHIDLRLIPENLKFFVAYHDAYEELEMPAETAGMLYMADTETGYVKWYDNLNEEWHKCYSDYNDIKDSDEFVEVDDLWRNGCISVREVLDDLEAEREQDDE